MQPRDDEYAREVIRTVGEMSRLLEQTRQDITRATLPLFPRITGIEKRLDEEAKDRPARQQQLDARLSKQDKSLEVLAARLTSQDMALGKQDQTLAAQDQVLVRISKWQRWRAALEVAILIALIVGFWYLRHGG